MKKWTRDGGICAAGTGVCVPDGTGQRAVCPEATLIESKMRCDQVMLGMSGGSSRALTGDIRLSLIHI